MSKSNNLFKYSLSYECLAFGRGEEVPAVPLEGDDVPVLQLQLAVVGEAEHLDVQRFRGLQVLCEVNATVANFLGRIRFSLSGQEF